MIIILSPLFISTKLLLIVTFLACSIILSNVFTFFYLKYEFEKDSDLEEVDTFFEEDTLVQKDITKVTVEIKGEVKKPGVYEVNSNKRVNDVISLAEG